MYIVHEYNYMRKKGKNVTLFDCGKILSTLAPPSPPPASNCRQPCSCYTHREERLRRMKEGYSHCVS